MEIISIAISILALSVSTAVVIWGWHRHRNIYDVERFIFFRKNQTDKSNNNNELKKKLRSGHYTVLHTSEYGGCIELILGKIKK